MKKIELSEKQLQTVMNMYKNELLGTHTISLKMGISKPTINRILKENGVIFGQSGRRFIGGKKVADKKWREKNKDYTSKSHKKWSEKNRDHLNEYHQKWREKNIDKHREYKRKYEKHRKDTDPLYKLISNFRTAIYQVLKENRVDKNQSYFDVLQYTPEQLIVHLEKQFTERITWENYGEWHVDHKQPISSFNIQEMGDSEFMKCWSLENLQPMWGEENIRKSNKIFNN
jgi:hypothetical protein